MKCAAAAFDGGQALAPHKQVVVAYKSMKRLLGLCLLAPWGLALLCGLGAVPAWAGREAYDTPSAPNFAKIEPAAGKEKPTATSAETPESSAPDHAAAETPPAETSSEDEANTDTPADTPAETPEDGADAHGEKASAETHGNNPHEAKKPKEKKSEGPPPLPKVIIGGQQVELAKIAFAAAEASVLPTALKEKGYPKQVQHRINFNAYAHSPRLGDPNAKLTVVIFEDLNCLSCTTASQDISVALKELFTSPTAPAVPTAPPATTSATAAVSTTTPLPPISHQVVWVYAPSSQFEGSNLAAFYGKVAARQGQFWAYREKLLQRPDRTTATAFGVLNELGLEPRITRQIMLSEARRFYRELDGDTQLVRSLGMGTPPSVLVNGIRLGNKGLPLELLPDVLTYIRNRIHAGMREPNPQ